MNILDKLMSLGLLKSYTLDEYEIVLVFPNGDVVTICGDREGKPYII